MNDINELVKELISQVIEKGLESEMEDGLGYSKYDYKNKETDNSRNGYSPKTLSTSFGEIDIDVPRDRKGEFEPQIIQKSLNPNIKPYWTIKKRNLRKKEVITIEPSIYLSGHKCKSHFF